MGQIVREPATCMKKGAIRGGVCQPPLQWLSQFLSYEREIIQLFMTLLLRTSFVVEWVDIYKGK